MVYISDYDLMNWVGVVYIHMTRQYVGSDG